MTNFETQDSHMTDIDFESQDQDMSDGDSETLEKHIRTFEAYSLVGSVATVLGTWTMNREVLGHGPVDIFMDKTCGTKVDLGYLGKDVSPTALILWLLTRRCVSRERGSIQRSCQRLWNNSRVL